MGGVHPSPGKGVTALPRISAAPLRVLLADDSDSLRLLMQVTLDDHPGFSVVATAIDGVEAVEMAQRQQPDLVLLDIAMPRMDGLEAIAPIRSVCPDARIAIFSGYSEARMGTAARAAGADLYLEKAAPDDEVIALLLELCGRPAEATVPPPRIPRPAPPPAEAPQGAEYVDLLLDALEEGVLVTDSAGVVQSVNFSATRLFGVPTSQLVGRHVSSLGISADDRTADGSDPISAALAIGRPVSAVDVAVQRPDGTTAYLLASVRPVLMAAAAEPHAAVASFVDISIRRHSEEQAHEAARRFGIALDTMLDSVALYTAIRDHNGDIVDFHIDHANPAIRAVTGRSAEDLIGRQLLELFPALRGSPLLAAYAHVVSTGQQLSADSLDYRPYSDGHLTPDAYRVRACRLGDGLIVTWRLVGRRVTDSPMPLAVPPAGG